MRSAQVKGYNVEQRLTETTNSAQGRNQDHPVVPPPQHPATVDQDVVTEKIAQRDEDVGGHKLRSFPRISGDASCCLPVNVKHNSVRGVVETYQSSHEMVQLQRPMDSAREEQCTMGDDHGQRQVARFPPRAQQHYRDDEQDRIDA